LGVDGASRERADPEFTSPGVQGKVGRAQEPRIGGGMQGSGSWTPSWMWMAGFPPRPSGSTEPVVTSWGPTSQWLVRVRAIASEVDQDRIEIRTWSEVSRDLRRALLVSRRSQWLAFARAFCGAIEQRLIGCPVQPVTIDPRSTRPGP
jgi:hypothetical protein